MLRFIGFGLVAELAIDWLVLVLFRMDFGQLLKLHSLVSSLSLLNRTLMKFFLSWFLVNFAD